MPMNRSLYPPDWKAIALKIKEKAGWTCQECGKPCLPPNTEWHDWVNYLLQNVSDEWYALTCDEIHDSETGEWGFVERPRRFTLTVAHLNHNPADCRPENLKALCSTCHLRYDAPHHARSRRANQQKKLENQGQLNLFNNATNS
ncbi:MAG TPA: hypothetical protein V6D27_00830 [Vampirovibrionales bacterium]